jgi:hypothetical protein
MGRGKNVRPIGEGVVMAKSGRVFLRGMTSETYGLKEFRTAPPEYGVENAVPAATGVTA